MDNATYKEVIDQLYKDRMKLVTERGAAYANEDTLASFKRVGALMTILVGSEESKIDWEQMHHLNMVVMKLDRLVNQIKNKSDSIKIEDTFKDLLNYIEIWYGSRVDRLP